MYLTCNDSTKINVITLYGVSSITSLLWCSVWQHRWQPLRLKHICFNIIDICAKGCWYIFYLFYSLHVMLILEALAVWHGTFGEWIYIMHVIRNNNAGQLLV